MPDVSEPGTVFVENFMDVVSRGSVQHLASHVRGQLRPGASCWDAFGALFPSVTASGIPKREACREIRIREGSPRGLYSGAVLSLDAKGNLDAALVLRSVYQVAGATWLRAGAGLISQSDPERELEETREKMRSVSRFLVPKSGDKCVITAHINGIRIAYEDTGGSGATVLLVMGTGSPAVFGRCIRYLR